MAPGTEQNPGGNSMGPNTVGTMGQLGGQSAVTAEPGRAQMSRERRGFSPSNGSETALKASGKLWLWLCSRSSAGRARMSRGKRGNPNPGSATARPKNNNSIIVSQCPLRSHLPLPGSACIPCRAFPAPSPCHCRRGPSSQPGFNPVVTAARDLSRFKSRSERSQRARRFPFSRWQLSQSRPCPGQKQRLPS